MDVSLSIIIPSGPSEKALVYLSDDLAELENNIEIILVHSEDADSEFWSEIKPKVDRILSGKNIRWIAAKQGRACQLNVGAAQATGSFLWFLHADSVLGTDTMQLLKTALHNQPSSMHYFKLAFSNDGPSFLMKVNEMAVRFRSKLLGMPFGDQGFCLTKSLFEFVGGYPENLPYGEDHVFVWRVRQAGIPLHCIQEKLFTSARKYTSNGWVKTTVTHNKLWMKQAIPEAMKYIQSRGIL